MPDPVNSATAKMNAADPNMFIDVRSVEDEEFVRKALVGPKPLRFDWENKWLRGDQYAHMLRNIDTYCSTFGMLKMGEK